MKSEKQKGSLFKHRQRAGLRCAEIYYGGIFTYSTNHSECHRSVSDDFKNSHRRIVQFLLPQRGSSKVTNHLDYHSLFDLNQNDPIREHMDLGSFSSSSSSWSFSVQTGGGGPLRGVTANVLVLLHYAIHLSITNTSNCHHRLRVNIVVSGQKSRTESILFTICPPLIANRDIKAGIILRVATNDIRILQQSFLIVWLLCNSSKSGNVSQLATQSEN